MNFQTALCILKRVTPAESWKSTKISICRVDFRTMFKSDGCEVGVRREVARRSYAEQQTPQQFKMLWSRLKDRSIGLGEPIAYQVQSFFRRERCPQSTCADPQECKQNVPGESNGIRPRKGRFQPSLRSFMEPRFPVERVNQQVCVGRDHRPSASLILRIVSSSSSSSAKAKAWVRSMWSEPAAYVFCTKRLPVRFGARPARIASLSARSNSTFRLQASLRSSSSTSGSRLTTVSIRPAYQRFLALTDDLEPVRRFSL
jgi:hypothetical protein